MSQWNMVNTMQSEGNSECIYISDESRSVPQLSALSKSPFAASDVPSNAGVCLVDEIEMEDLSDDIIVPVTPSPLLNNKRQQHIAMERGIKRTCLEKAFSTMSTSSNNCTSGTDVMDCQFQRQEELFTENNSKSLNGKENNNKFSVTSISKNNIPSKGKEILSFPRKLMSQNNVFNSSKSGILKPENNFSDAQVLEKPKVFIPRKRNTVIINSDSDDSADNMTESSYRNILHPVQSSYELRSSKEPNSDNKICQKNRTMVEHCPNKSSSEKLFENNGFMKAKKFTNKYSSTLKTDSSNRGKSHICKESNFRPVGLQYDAHLESATNRNLKSQFRITKRSPKTTCRDHYHEHEARCSATTSYNNSKSTYTMSKSQDHSNKNTDGVPNQRNNNEASVQINAIASTSSKSENGKIRRKHSHRGQISRYPVEDSDTDVEFYDAKSDLSDLADSKRPTKVGRKKKIQRRRIMECLSSDSSSDVSIVTEMRISPCNNKTPKQHLRNTESPDPVEQVRQMEEDERLAYMLQAQFDAELEGNESNEEICGDFNSSILSSLSVDSASSSSDSSSSSSFSATAAEAVFPFLVSSSLSPRILRDINGHSFGQTRRSSRIQQRQQSIIGWMPESVRTVLTAWMPNFTEDNTYESLLEISEQIGEESLGLKKQQINSLPTRKFSTIHMMDSSSASGAGSRECQDCTICLCEYQNDDTLRSLPCCHEFHATCIDRWLKSHSTCPICRIEVTLRRPFGRKRKS